MPSHQEAVRTAAAHGQPDVSKSLEELLCELEREIKPLDLVQDDDLTRKKYAERYRISPNAAGDALDKLVRAGKLIRVNKRCLNGATVATYHRASPS